MGSSVPDPELSALVEEQVGDLLTALHNQPAGEALAKLRLFREMAERLDSQTLYQAGHELLK